MVNVAHVTEAVEALVSTSVIAATSTGEVQRIAVEMVNRLWSEVDGYFAEMLDERD